MKAFPDDGLDEFNREVLHHGVAQWTQKQKKGSELIQYLLLAGDSEREYDGHEGRNSLGAVWRPTSHSHSPNPMAPRTSTHRHVSTLDFGEDKNLGEKCSNWY
jgi:hypothetical protein